MRRPCRVVVLIVGLALTLPLSSPAVAADGVDQPAAPYAGAAAPEFEAEYRAVQADPESTEETRVKAAVDVYFRLKYESALRLEALDPGFLIDLDTASGRNLYNYELGRCEYFVAAWRRSNSRIDRYEYAPEYLSVRVDGSTASAEMYPWARVSAPSGPFSPGGELHTLLLTRAGEGWKLVEDAYENDVIQNYPRGTDFSKLIASLDAENAEDPPVEPLVPGQVGPPHSPWVVVPWVVASLVLVLLAALLLRRSRQTR